MSVGAALQQDVGTNVMKTFTSPQPGSSPWGGNVAAAPAMTTANVEVRETMVLEQC